LQCGLVGPSNHALDGITFGGTRHPSGQWTCLYIPLDASDITHWGLHGTEMWAKATITVATCFKMFYTILA